jgi:hypothetical protein
MMGWLILIKWVRIISFVLCTLSAPITCSNLGWILRVRQEESRDQTQKFDTMWEAASMMVEQILKQGSIDWTAFVQLP